MDEKAFRKGHNYLTLVNDLRGSRVLYVAEDREQKSLDGFWGTLTEEQRAGSNLTMRMSMRRFTRLTNGFSKKIENHACAVAVYMMIYNFARIHKTLRCTPAMEAGIADHVWSYEEIAALVPEAKAGPRGPYKQRQNS